MAAPADNSEGLAGLLSVVLAHTSVLQAADSSIDGKANNLMAAALVLVPLLGIQLLDSNHHWHWIVVVPMLCMIATIVLVIYLAWDREYSAVVVDLDANRDYFTKPNDVLLAQLIEDADKANDENTVILNNKARLFRWAVICFLTGFSLALIALFIIH